MSKIIPGTFTRYELTDLETLNGSILNEMQLQRLQNHLADVADQILALEFDPENPKKFLQDDSFLKGQMSFIRFLVDSSAESFAQLMQMSQQSVSNQSE
jgi:hypothetical protein